MKTIVVTAYAINPYKGSEDGTGWNWVCQMAKENNIIAITRKNNKTAIDKYIDEHENGNIQNLSFKYFDLPAWSRFWKRGEYSSLIYYYLWQFFIPYFILFNNFKYDILHHLNFHNDWTPSFLWILNKPLIWGPIGHHPKIRKEYYNKSYPARYYLSNKIRWWIKKFFWFFDPFLKITKNKADHIFVMHKSVADNLKLDKEKYTVVPAIAAEIPKNSFNKIKIKEFNVLSIGRFIPLKAFDITLKAFAKFYNSLDISEQNNVKLNIVGKGKLEKELKQLSESLNIPNAVVFNKWMSKSELNNLYRRSSCMFFPSHEGAGMVVIEGLSYELPVLCFDNIGPGAFIDKTCGAKIKYSNYEQSINEFSSQLLKWYRNPELLNSKSEGAKNRFIENFQWSHKADAVNNALTKIEYKYAKSSLHPSV